MTTYILHGGFMREQNAQNDAFYDRVCELVPDGGTILLNYFASDEARATEHFPQQVERIRLHAGDKKFTFVCATKENFVEELQAADALLIRGGSTNRLLEALQAYPEFVSMLADTKLVTGSSAGAYVLAAYNYDKSERRVRAGLGLVQVRAACHYMSETLDGIGDDALAVMESAHTELPLVVLRDYEWKEFTN